MTDVQLAAAFFGGLISFFSPCVYPLIPILLSYMGATGSDWKVALYSSSLYFLGLAITMIVTGVGLTFLASTVLSMTYLLVVSSLIMIVFGSMLLIPNFWYRFGLGKYVNIPRTRRGGPVGAFLIGVTFGFSWTPCVTPIYVSIVSVAVAGGEIATAALLMFFYALGMGLPLIVIGVAAATAKIMLGKRSSQVIAYVERASGAALILLGVNSLLPLLRLPRLLPF